MSKSVAQKSRLLGSFAPPGRTAVFGELRLKGGKTNLRLRDDKPINVERQVPVIHGWLHDLYKASCIDCVVGGPGRSSREGEGSFHFRDVFPHFVAIGNAFLLPDQPSIAAVYFTVDDATSLFYDFDAFGLVFPTRELVKEVIAVSKLPREVAIGESPLIAYFTGKQEIVSVKTNVGKVSVAHAPSFTSGGPTGVQLGSRLIVSIEPPQAVVLEQCIEDVLSINRFLTLLSGRAQGVKAVRIDLAAGESLKPQLLDLKWPLAPKGAKRRDYDRPHPGDIPLDAVRRPEEFQRVLSAWLAKDASRKTARGRYSACLAKGNLYDTDRLVAAANMFDILPNDAVPVGAELPAELATAQQECLGLLRLRPSSIPRDSAIDALSRMGKPSLPKKVRHRVSLLEPQLAGRFPDLDLVAKTAVKCRNYFVHGSSGDFNFEKISRFMGFLTDALEFIFAASELLECGWDAQRWNKEAHGTGHNFARFRAEYDEASWHLKVALGV